jgi:hypothetical protein
VWETEIGRIFQASLAKKKFASPHPNGKKRCGRVWLLPGLYIVISKSETLFLRKTEQTGLEAWLKL